MELIDVDACTLPTAQRPLRQQELTELFAAHVVRRERPATTRASLRLEGDAGLAARVRDLAERETACCSFFGFEVSEPGPGVVLLDVDVPAAYADVLTALVDLGAS